MPISKTEKSAAKSYDQHRRHKHKSIIIFGPQGSGKTLHAPAIAKHFGLGKVIDGEGTQPTGDHQTDCLIIHQFQPPTQVRRALHINEALRLLREQPAGYPF